MGVLYDVDKFLTSYDLEQFYVDHAKWPWPITHFIIMENCFGCKLKVNNSTRTQHFTRIMDNTDIWNLLQSSYFWCDFCEFSVYDHFTDDECYYCV